MKSKIMMVLFAALMSLSVSAAEPVRTIQMKVDGLVCAFCAQGINKQLRALEQTADVWVSLEKFTVAVEPKAGQDIPDARLRSVLTDAGYSVREITRSAETLEALRKRLGS